MNRPSLFTVPGYTGSGPRHWQSLWEADDPRIRRIEQHDWDHPEAEAWSRTIETAVRSVDGPVVLVAHSCGATAVAHWAARFTTPLAGAFLVAPPDDQRNDLDEAIRSFGLPQIRRLPFSSVVVASETDPYCDMTVAATIAQGWGASLVSAGDAGHINTASGHGPWPEGRRFLDEFLSKLHD